MKLLYSSKILCDFGSHIELQIPFLTNKTTNALPLVFFLQKVGLSNFLN
ncbi:hypothetical protein GAPWKB30_1547 [Gilliamella apicola]|nr:hypothetical protein GAPWKB30_1547 [Gilliamella apicola]